MPVLYSPAYPLYSPSFRQEPRGPRTREGIFIIRAALGILLLKDVTAERPVAVRERIFIDKSREGRSQEKASLLSGPPVAILLLHCEDVAAERPVAVRESIFIDKSREGRRQRKNSLLPGPRRAAPHPSLLQDAAAARPVAVRERVHF